MMHSSKILKMNLLLFNKVKWEYHFVTKESVSITNFVVSQQYLYFTERYAGADSLQKMNLSTKEVKPVKVEFELADISFPDVNVSDFEAGNFRFVMESFRSQIQSYEIDELYQIKNLIKKGA